MAKTMVNKMDTDEYLTIPDLDREGKNEEAFQLLLRLAEKHHPLALFELSSRYYSTDSYTPAVLPLLPDPDKSKFFAIEGERQLRDLASKQDGEAMRMLGYMYLGHLSPHHKDFDEAEKWLLKAFEAGCYVAANDLSTLYLNSNIEKAKHWYKEAERHKCRFIFNEQCEN